MSPRTYQVSEDIAVVTDQRGIVVSLIVPAHFDGIVSAVRWILREHYPESVFPRDRPFDEGDPGPRFLRHLRAALDCLPETPEARVAREDCAATVNLYGPERIAELEKEANR